MKNSNNVINFTDALLKKYNHQFDLFSEEYAEEESYNELDETLIYMYDTLLDACVEMGVASDEDDFIKDFAYTMEAVKSMVDRSFGNDHTFHDVIDRKLHISRNLYGEVVSVDWLPNLTSKE